MKCQTCDSDLRDYPVDAVEADDDALGEVVAHHQEGEEQFVARRTYYYCDLACAAAADGGDA